MNRNGKLGFAVLGAVAMLGLVLSSSPTTAQTYNFGDYTVVEADPFASGGIAGNTTAVGGGFFSGPDFNTTTWQNRLVFPFNTGYESVPGASNRVFEASNGAPEVVTTISGLAASTYEVSLVYLYRQDSDTGAGVVANLYGSTNPVYSRQLYDRSEVETTIGTPGGTTWAVGLASLGTTAAGSTSFNVNIAESDDNQTNGIYTNGGYFGLAYKPVADIPSFSAPAGFINAADVIYGGAFNTADSTEKLQAAFDTGLDVFVPKMASSWVTDKLFLTNDNQTVLFEEGVVVEAIAGKFLQTGDALLTANGVANVRLEGYGATLRMRQNDYTQAPYSAGEWRHGIALLDVTDVEIAGLTVEDTGGDGIYVGVQSAASSTFSKNVVIQDVTINNAYRNGISVISVEDLLIDNATVINTGGTNPQAGIDFEPNNSAQRIVNATVRNSIIANSEGHGIQWFFNNGDASTSTGLVENVTVYSNDNDGLNISDRPLLGWEFRNSLVVGNADDGFRVDSGPGTQTIEHSAFRDNAGGNLSGDVVVGTGTTGSATPVFVSTDPNDPLFLYLDLATSGLITLGASDGGYIGARPVSLSGDFDGDTDTDGFDFLQWQRGESLYALDRFELIDWELNFGASGGALAAGADAVPEPSTFLLMLAGLASGLLLSRRKSRIKG